MVQLRHQRTRPQKGRGGLDGTGRMNPAVDYKFMMELEEAVPHLARTDLVDKLVWKDVVEFRFRVGGLSRPKGLLYPWPVLENLAEEYRINLLTLAKLNEIDQDARKLGRDTIAAICDLPMDVSLLKSSGIGKAVKKFLKMSASSECLQVFDEPISSQNLRETPRTNLETVLESWMAMANHSGVQIDSCAHVNVSVDTSCLKELAKARKCSCWRELHAVLTEFDEKRLSNQGARMRERRERLNSVRPKIVKVKTASSRQNAILNRQQPGATLSQGRQKMQMLRMEASVTLARRSAPIKTLAMGKPPVKQPSGFGAAVAFAQQGRKRKGAKITIPLAGNKRMRIPDSKKAAANLKRFAKKGSFR